MTRDKLQKYLISVEVQKINDANFDSKRGVTRSICKSTKNWYKDMNDGKTGAWV